MSERSHGSDRLQLGPTLALRCRSAPLATDGRDTKAVVSVQAGQCRVVMGWSPRWSPDTRRNQRAPPSVHSDLVLLGAPPGFRTQNLRIKSPENIVQVMLAYPLTWCSVRPSVYRVVPNPSGDRQLATKIGTKAWAFDTELFSGCCPADHLLPSRPPPDRIRREHLSAVVDAQTVTISPERAAVVQHRAVPPSSSVTGRRRQRVGTA